MKKILCFTLALIMMSPMLLHISCKNAKENDASSDNEKESETVAETENIKRPETPAEYFIVAEERILGLKEFGKSLKEIVVPAKINGYKITQIYEYAFSDREGKENTSLEYVEIGKNVSIIGKDALASCVNLREIKIGKNVTKIGENFLYNCPKVEKIDIDDNNKAFSDEGNCLIEKGTKTLHYGFKDCRIQSGIENIAPYALYKCNSENIELPESLVKIGKGAFEECLNLKEVILNSNLKTIEEDAFKGCKNLKKVINKSNVKVIGTNCFANCVNLTDVVFEKSFQNISRGMFSGCTNLMELNIPEGTLYVEEYAFGDKDVAKKVYLPLSINSLMENSFINCDIYYAGNENQWQSIKDGLVQSGLASCRIHFTK